MNETLRIDVERSVYDFIVRHLKENGREKESFDDQTDPFSSSLLDSLALAQLVMHVENETGREIDFLMIDPEALGTVGSLVDSFTEAASEDALVA